MRVGTLALLFFFVLGVNGTGCSNPSIVGVQTYGAVTGRVLDATTNQPIPNALVSVGSLFTAMADNQGAFMLAHIPTGDQEVTARAPGYVTRSVDVTIAKHQTASVNYIRLRPSTGSATVILPPQTPSPTPSATPTAGAPSASPSASPSSPTGTPPGERTSRSPHVRPRFRSR
ncbi:MAG: carboxypeptidase regulatory-like domain-containing protein [Vulcanimicrobiaceae bacterium]